MLVPSFWIIYFKKNPETAFRLRFTPVTNFPEWLNVNRVKNKQSKKNSLRSATGMTNLCFLLFFPGDLLVRETPNAVWVSDKLVSQDILMFMLVLLEQKDENKGKEPRVETNRAEIFWQCGKGDGEMSPGNCGKMERDRREEDWEVAARASALSDSLAAFCWLEPRTPRRSSSAESHETGSCVIVSDRSATVELTQMLLFSSGGTTDTILYQFPCLASDGWRNH